MSAPSAYRAGSFPERFLCRLPSKRREVAGRTTSGTAARDDPRAKVPNSLGRHGKHGFFSPY